MTVKLKEPPNRFASDLSDADLADLADTQAASADGEERGRVVRDGMLPYFRLSALGRDTRIPTVTNVPNACALCGKGLLPAGHHRPPGKRLPGDRNTQDNWVYAGIPA